LNFLYCVPLIFRFDQQKFGLMLLRLFERAGGIRVIRGEYITIYIESLLLYKISI